MSTTYNPDKLAEAIKAFGEERLEEYKKVHLEARLAMWGDDYVLVIGLDVDEDPYFINAKTKCIGDCFKGGITYLEPPRPLRKEGHTKSDMLEFAVKVFESTNEGTLMGNGGTLGLYKLMFPTATAPTEEVKEGTNWEKAFKTVLAKYEDTLKKYSDPQPEPSFTRGEVSKR